MATYSVCVGQPLESWKEIQQRPMLCPLTQASPFPIELKFKATGSFPLGASKNICKIISLQYYTWINYTSILVINYRVKNKNILIIMYSHHRKLTFLIISNFILKMNYTDDIYLLMRMIEIDPLFIFFFLLIIRQLEEERFES